MKFSEIRITDNPLTQMHQVA